MEHVFVLALILTMALYTLPADGKRKNTSTKVNDLSKDHFKGHHVKHFTGKTVKRDLSMHYIEETDPGLTGQSVHSGHILDVIQEQHVNASFAQENVTEAKPIQTINDTKQTNNSLKDIQTEQAESKTQDIPLVPVLTEIKVDIPLVPVLPENKVVIPSTIVRNDSVISEVLHIDKSSASEGNAPQQTPKNTQSNPVNPGNSEYKLEVKPAEEKPIQLDNVNVLLSDVIANLTNNNEAQPVISQNVNKTKVEENSHQNITEQQVNPIKSDITNLQREYEEPSAITTFMKAYHLDPFLHFGLGDHIQRTANVVLPDISELFQLHSNDVEQDIDDTFGSNSLDTSAGNVEPKVVENETGLLQAVVQEKEAEKENTSQVGINDHKLELNVTEIKASPVQSGFVVNQKSVQEKDAGPTNTTLIQETINPQNDIKSGDLQSESVAKIQNKTEADKPMQSFNVSTLILAANNIQNENKTTV